MVIEVAQAGATARYAKKRDAIVAAATDVVNRQGVKGMTLSEVAAQVGLNTTSVTYYFRKKEDLAAACYLSTLERLSDVARTAAQAGEPAARVERLLGLFLENLARQRAGEDPPYVVLSGIRTLEEPHYSVVTGAFAAMTRLMRDLIAPAGYERRVLHARTYLLLEQVLWSTAWLTRYDVEDYPRIQARMHDILLGGVLPGETAWPPNLLSAAMRGEPRDAGQLIFLNASTRLVNRLGYRGASVDKISAELNVTKGSFYHHNETKDDLVMACFDRTEAVIRQVQRAAIEAGGQGGVQLSRALATLIDHQMTHEGPLLRSAALLSMPAPLCTSVAERAGRMNDRFAAIIADGVSDGSVRRVDPAIAAHMMMTALHAAAETPAWVKGATREDLQNLITRPALFGLFV